MSKEIPKHYREILDLIDIVLIEAREIADTDFVNRDLGFQMIYAKVLSWCSEIADDLTPSQIKQVDKLYERHILGQSYMEMVH